MDKKNDPKMQAGHGNGFRKFLFKASAVALSGSVRKPYYQNIGEHGVVATYAGSAGHNTARNERFTLRQDIAYDAAFSEISAEQSKSVYRTVVQSTIENLRILGKRFTVERVIGRLESVYDVSSYPGRKVSRVLPAGSAFVNVRIDGKPVELKVSPAFNLSERERSEFFAGKHDDDPRFRPGVIPDPIHIGDFGTIFFAEWVWVHPDEMHEQSLTMLRFALGSGFGAAVDGVRLKSNGSGWPP